MVCPGYEPIIDITHEGEAIIYVTTSAEAEPLIVRRLTKQGVMEIGRWLAVNGYRDWAYCSSCDFPREYKPGFRYDVRELIIDGWNDY